MHPSGERPVIEARCRCYAACVLGVALTTYEVMDQRAAMLGVLLEVLAEVGAEHCLIGGIAVGYHSRPRATIDVDMLIPARSSMRIAQALERRGYVVSKDQGMLRVYPPGGVPGKDEAIADLVEREANPTLREAARASEQAVVLGHPVRLVQRGALVALKFQAAVSPTRRIDDRYIDVGDIGRILRTKFDASDEIVALAIADTIYTGARDDLSRMIDDLRNNRPVKL
jgi:hypothetical protein